MVSESFDCRTNKMFLLGPNKTDHINKCVYCPWNFWLLFHFCRYDCKTPKPGELWSASFFFE